MTGDCLLTMESAVCGEIFAPCSPRDEETNGESLAFISLMKGQNDFGKREIDGRIMPRLNERDKFHQRIQGSS